MKNAENGRFFSYLVDYVIENDARIIALRKQEGIPEKGFNYHDTDSWREDQLVTIMVGDVLKTVFEDFLFIGQDGALDVLKEYILWGDTELNFFEFQQYGNYVVEDTYEKAELNEKVTELLNTEKKDHYSKHIVPVEIKEHFKKAETFPVSIQISKTATLSSLKKFITQQWPEIEYIIKYRSGGNTKYSQHRKRAINENLIKLCLFINKDLPTKDLRGLIKKKFGKDKQESQIRNIIASFSVRNKK